MTAALPIVKHIQGFSETESDILVYFAVVNGVKPLRTRLPDRQHSKAKSNHRRAPADKSLQCAACLGLGHLAIDCIFLSRGIWMKKFMDTNKDACLQIQKVWKDKKDADQSAKVTMSYMDATGICAEQMYDELDVDPMDIFNQSIQSQ